MQIENFLLIQDDDKQVSCKANPTREVNAHRNIWFFVMRHQVQRLALFVCSAHGGNTDRKHYFL